MLLQSFYITVVLEHNNFLETVNKFALHMRSYLNRLEHLSLRRPWAQDIFAVISGSDCESAFKVCDDKGLSFQPSYHCCRSPLHHCLNNQVNKGVLGGSSGFMNWKWHFSNFLLFCWVLWKADWRESYISQQTEPEVNDEEGRVWRAFGLKMGRPVTRMRTDKCERGWKYYTTAANCCL